jgi:hypothetical protein
MIQPIGDIRAAEIMRGSQGSCLLLSCGNSLPYSGWECKSVALPLSGAAEPQRWYPGGAWAIEALRAKAGPELSRRKGKKSKREKGLLKSSPFGKPLRVYGATHTTRKPPSLKRSPRSSRISRLREAERQDLGRSDQEPPRRIRLPLSGSLSRALPSVGAPS